MRPVWEELSALLTRARKRGVRNLSAEELARLDRLYRQSTVHLAQMRSRTQNQTLIGDLNRLVANAHAFIYAAPERRPVKSILRFYLTGFPRAVARTRWVHLASLLLFFAGGLTAHFGLSQQPVAAYALTPAGDPRLPGSSREQLVAVLRHGRDVDEGGKLLFASFLFAHNTKIGFLAFASGVLAAVPTVFLIALNGAMLGTFTAIHHTKGIVWEMWAWLLPHGVTEILAVVFCGGAGLMLGLAVLRPGHRSRRQSLMSAGREALYLVLGVVPMFLAAGIIESYVRQSHLDTRTRLLFAACTVFFWAAYLSLGGWLEYRRKGRGSASA